MRKLFLIPARGGSKGLPRKNILPLAGRPMIYYTLDAALGAMEAGDELCVSTDDLEIIEKTKEYGIDLPFIRPSSIASDFSTTLEVINHALHWYSSKGKIFDLVILLQPTSPLRTFKHVQEAIGLWDDHTEVVVSVKETDANPYYVLFEEDDNGFLIRSKKDTFSRRQDCPKVYELNGAIYVFSAKKEFNRPLLDVKRLKKLKMDKYSSVDIDDLYDFKMAQIYLENERRI